ncbi:transcription factor grauzone [Musca domestica]|uniref:Transcription factor grauzone n=1 Tax=Musca domestica TaxID=7370 RepID=A0A1I8M4A0_MUSDO|nr:transcription factor grauzone [Musca domestica]XP_058979863.1 transcription factor grauzone [Musca domestica]
MLIEFIEEDFSDDEISDKDSAGAVVTTKYSIELSSPGPAHSKQLNNFSLKRILSEEPKERNHNKFVEKKYSAKANENVNLSKTHLNRKLNLKKKSISKQVPKCILCCESIEDDTMCIKAQSPEWKDKNVREIIDKHLCYMQHIPDNSSVCLYCWDVLHAFHELYTKIQEVQKHLQSHHLILENDPLEGNVKEEYMLEDDVEEPTKDVDEYSNRGDGDCISENENIDYNSEEETISMENSSRGNKRRDANYKEDEENVDRQDNKSFEYEEEQLDENQIIENEDIEDHFEDEETCDDNDESSQYANETIGEREELPKEEYDDFLKKHFKIACQKCDQPFETFKLYIKHCRQVHKERGHVICCDTKFQFRKYLVDHIQYHLNPDYFKCNHCGKQFTARSYLRIHKELHEDGKFACNLCDKKFPRNYMLQRHQRKMHSPQPAKSLPCEDCGKLYTCQRTLQYHRKHVHLKHFSRVCEICGQTLPTLFAYQQHKLRHNPNPVRCEDCGLLVTSQVTLKYHRDLKHPPGGNREYKCDMCPRVCPNLRALKSHSLVHSTVYKFQCMVCDKKFKTKDIYTYHMARHTGTALFTCQWCPATFYRSGSISLHRRKYHPIEWEKEKRRKMYGETS